MTTVSLENMTSGSLNLFPIILTRSFCKMCPNYGRSFSPDEEREICSVSVRHKTLQRTTKKGTKMDVARAEPLHCKLDPTALWRFRRCNRC